MHERVGLSLPLSWSRSERLLPQFHTRRLPLSRLHWVVSAALPAAYRFDQVYDEYLRRLPGGFVVRGCNPTQARFLAAQGCRIVQIGSEALVDLHGAGMQRQSVRKMVRHARRYGMVEEVAWSAEAAASLQRIAAGSRYGARPQLRYLFRTAFTPDTRLFVFIGTSGERYGALLLSQPHPQTAVTELMLRRPDAPAGVMEALFSSAAEQLRAEGVRTLSLNEVPFQAAERGGWEYLITAGSLLLRGAYNTAGLQRFKAKFAPHWRPAYLCATPQLSLQLLVDLFIVSGCLHLAAHDLWRRVRP